MYNSQKVDRKRPSSIMKTPTRSRVTLGGMQINSGQKTDNAGQSRFSIGGMVPASARRTSVFRSLTSTFKDTRQLSSKEYQNEMIRKIYDFLLEHDGENCLPERLIRSPTKQDFVVMFESIYQHLNPDFQLRNVVEEVPVIFRELGYPTAIKPSTMQTIGAAHSWPTLLGALTWLIDVVEIDFSLRGQGGQQLLLGGDDSSGTLKAYRYSWLNSGFKEYQKRKEPISESFFENKIRALRVWFEQQEDFESQQQAAENALKQINEECAELEAEKGDVDRLHNDIARIADDIAKATTYANELEEDIKQLSDQQNVVNVEQAGLSKQAEEYRAQLSEIQSAVKAQEEGDGLCGSEARALIAEIDQNKLTIRKLKGELEDLCKQHWHAVPETKNAFAEQQERYRVLLLDIKNLYASLLCEEPSMVEENIEDVRSLYNALLENCKHLLEETETKFLQRKWDLEQLIRQFTSQADNIKQEDGVISGKLRERRRMEERADRQRRRDRDDWDKDVIAAEAEIDRLENEKEVLETKHHEIGGLKRDLESLRSENAEYSKFLLEKQSQVIDAVLTRFYQIVTDLDMMKDARLWLTRKFEDIASSVSQLEEDDN